MATETTTRAKPVVLIAFNTSWGLLNFWSGRIRALLDAGYDVVVVAPRDDYTDRLPLLGCRYVLLPMDNMKTNPASDLLLFLRYFLLFRRERPDVVLPYTVKPSVYGSIAAHSLRIPVINCIPGLGYVFMKDNWLSRLLKFMFRLALARSFRVFFQNEDDRRFFVNEGLVRREVTDLVPGSGVDLTKFSFISRLPSTAGEGKFRFLLVARLLWDKGVGEYVEAARRLRQSRPHAECALLGFLDVKNPAAIARVQMDEWVAEGVVTYLGVSDDVSEQIATADCMVLPSYREGTPRALLEGAAMGRPIVSTDVAGCREVVVDGVNGFLCHPRDAGDLAEKMERMLDISSEERERMGRKGREKMEREFDERIVINKYMQAIDSVMASEKVRMA